jgi:hypothetical protein
MLKTALEGGLSDVSAFDAEEFEALKSMPEFVAMQEEAREGTAPDDPAPKTTDAARGVPSHR